MNPLAALLTVILALLSFPLHKGRAAVDEGRPGKITFKFANDEFSLDILRRRSFSGESPEEWQKRIDSYPEPPPATVEERLRRRGAWKSEADIHRVYEHKRVLDETVISKMDFQDATMDEVIGFLGRNVKAPIIFDGGDDESPRHRVSLSLKNVPASYALGVLGYPVEFLPEGILVHSQRVFTCSFTEEFEVKPVAMKRLLEKAEMKGSALPKGEGQKLLEKLGFTPLPGVAIAHIPEGEALIVRFNDADDLLRFEAIMDEVCGRVEEAKRSLEQRKLDRWIGSLLERRRELRDLRLEELVIKNCSLHKLRDELMMGPLSLNLSFIRKGGPLEPGSALGNRVSEAELTIQKVTISQENVSVMEFLQELARYTGAELIVGLHEIVLILPAAALGK
jgi:hypothetical protein